MKALLASLALLAFAASAAEYVPIGAYGDPLAPGTGLTVDNTGKTTLLCGFIMVGMSGVYSFDATPSAKVWIDRELVVHYVEITKGQHSIIVEIPKTKKALTLQWQVPALVTENVPTKYLYPKMSSNLPGCQKPEVQPAAPVLRAPL
jgi:hypothetical protein